MDDFVASRLVERSVDRLSLASLHTINLNWGRQRIGELARRFELGRRQFNRRFTRAIGASPKQVSTVLRAQKAIACIRAGQPFHDIVDRCGFADQAHFIREVSSHSNRTPGELAAMLDIIVADLSTRLAKPVEREILRLQTFGLGESTAQQIITDAVKDWPADVELGFRAGAPQMEIKLSIDSHDSCVLAVGTRQFAKLVPRSASSSMCGVVSRS